jgi:hypothetical protein
MRETKDRRGQVCRPRMERLLKMDDAARKRPLDEAFKEPLANAPHKMRVTPISIPAETGPLLNVQTQNVQTLLDENARLRAELKRYKSVGAIQISPRIHTVQNDHSVRSERMAVAVPSSGGMAVTTPASRRALLELPKPSNVQDDTVTKFSRLFEPSQDLFLLHTLQFAQDVIHLAKLVRPIFAREPKLLHLRSGIYVMGDTHGNLQVFGHQITIIQVRHTNEGS